MENIYAKLACFAGGALFGSLGLKLLASKDAKKAYVHAAAAGLRMKDSVMETELNEARAAKEAEEAAAADLEGEAED